MRKGLLLAVFVVGCGGAVEGDDTACFDTEVQLAAGCAEAFPRRYSLAAVSARIPALSPAGEPWDADGGPDPYLEVSVNGRVVGESEAIRDSTAPAFAGVPGAVVAADIDAGDLLTIRLLDADPDGAEPIVEFEVPATAKLLRWLMLYGEVGEGEAVLSLAVGAEP
jgi:hypothetical protein